MQASFIWRRINQRSDDSKDEVLEKGKTLVVNEEKDILRSLQTEVLTVCRPRASAGRSWTAAMEVSCSSHPSKAEFRALSFEHLVLVGRELPWDHTHECCKRHILQGLCHLVTSPPALITGITKSSGKGCWRQHRVHTRIDNIKHGFIQAFSFIFFFLDWHIFTSYLNLKLVLQRGSEWAGTGNRPANVFNLCFWNLLLESPLTLQVKFVVSYQNYFNPQLKNKITSFQSQIWIPGEREFTSSRVVCSCCRGGNPAVAGMVGAATRWVV